MPLVNGWFAVDTGAWKRHGVSSATVSNVLKLRQVLRAVRFDMGVDMQGTIRSAVVGRMAGARQFVGMATPREGVARWLYGERVSLSAAHVVEQGCELLGAAVGEVLRPAKVVLPVDAAAESWCDALRLEGEICFHCSQGGLGSEGVAGEALWCRGGGAGAGWIWGAGEFCGAGFYGRCCVADE